MLIVVDDLESLDAESSDVIARLIERTFADRLLVAAAAGALAGETLDPWRRLAIDADRAITLELTGLEESVAIELVRNAWPDADDVLGHRLWQHTAGNPLFLRTILREHTLDEVRDAEELPAPRELVRTSAARLQRLDAEGAALLRAVVVLGDRWTSAATAATLAGLDDATAAGQRLRDQGLLLARGQQIRAASGVLGTAVADTIPPAQRRALHQAAANLVDTPIDALRHQFPPPTPRPADDPVNLVASSVDAVDEFLETGLQLGVPLGQDLRQVGQFHVEVLRDPAQDVERLLAVDAAPLHQNALGLADHVPAGDGLAQVLDPQLGRGGRLGAGQRERGMRGQQQRDIAVVRSQCAAPPRVHVQRPRRIRLVGVRQQRGGQRRADAVPYRFRPEQRPGRRTEIVAERDAGLGRLDRVDRGPVALIVLEPVEHTGQRIGLGQRVHLACRVAQGDAGQVGPGNDLADGGHDPFERGSRSDRGQQFPGQLGEPTDEGLQQPVIGTRAGRHLVP